MMNSRFIRCPAAVMTSPTYPLHPVGYVTGFIAMSHSAASTDNTSDPQVGSGKPLAKAFIDGRRVDDFLTVDDDRIFTTGIGAIKELDHQLTDESVEVTLLQNKVADLEGQLAAQQQDASAQEERIAALEAGERTRQARNEAQQAGQSASAKTAA